MTFFLVIFYILNGVPTISGNGSGHVSGNGVPTAKIPLGTPFPGVPAGNDHCYDHELVAENLLFILVFFAVSVG